MEIRHMGRNAGLWLPVLDDNSQWLCIFGMGGQLAIYYPDKDVILITTADTQGRQGGVQLIYDAFTRKYTVILMHVLIMVIIVIMKNSRSSRIHASFLCSRANIVQTL